MHHLQLLHLILRADQLCHAFSFSSRRPSIARLCATTTLFCSASERCSASCNTQARRVITRHGFLHFLRIVEPLLQESFILRLVLHCLLLQTRIFLPSRCCIRLVSQQLFGVRTRCFLFRGLYSHHAPFVLSLELVDLALVHEETAGLVRYRSLQRVLYFAELSAVVVHEGGGGSLFIFELLYHRNLRFVAVVFRLSLLPQQLVALPRGLLLLRQCLLGVRVRKFLLRCDHVRQPAFVLTPELRQFVLEALAFTGMLVRFALLEERIGVVLSARCTLREPPSSAR